jgi:hypothetical protein
MLTYHAFLLDNDSPKETLFPDDFKIHDGVSEDAEMSKRNLDSASKTFSKLGKFFKIGKTPTPKKPSGSWSWGSRRRRRSGKRPGTINLKFLSLIIRVRLGVNIRAYASYL